MNRLEAIRERQERPPISQEERAAREDVAWLLDHLDGLTDDCDRWRRRVRQAIGWAEALLGQIRPPVGIAAHGIITGYKKWRDIQCARMDAMEDKEGQ